jgi:hypothetical protein
MFDAYTVELMMGNEWMLGLTPSNGAIPPDVWSAKGSADLLALVDAHGFQYRHIPGPTGDVYLTRYLVAKLRLPTRDPPR